MFIGHFISCFANIYNNNYCIHLNKYSELKTLKIYVFFNIHSFLQNPFFEPTVKPAVAATSIKRDPPLSGHSRAPRTISNANAPLLSVHLSNAASGRRNSPQNAEIVPSNGQFLCIDGASFD